MIRINENGETEIALINIFESINGEGYNCGKPTIFIRCFGCNLRCSWCDTKECWTKENLLKVYPGRKNWTTPFKWMTAKQIFDEVSQRESKYKHKSVCLTGGEPFHEDNKEFMMNELLPLFLDNKYDLGVETDGGIDLTDYKTKFGDSKIVDGFGSREGLTLITDYKLPSSGMTKMMVDSNFDLYSELDLVKMVISDNEEDWKQLDHVVNVLNKKSGIYISPCFGKVTMKRIPNYVLSNPNKNIKAQIQIHKIFWEPTKKDV